MRDQKKELIHIIWKEVEQFIKDWQKSPYEWSNEIDIQVEITSRLKSAFKRCLKHTQKAKYKDVKNKGFEHLQIYSRVCCEPLIYYKYGKAKRYPCYPDIVVYDEIRDPYHPPDDNNKRKNWPMLWVCEIKYQNEFSGGSSLENKIWDTGKMQCLFNQPDGAKNACCLIFNRIIAKSGNGILSEGKNKKFRQYTISLPRTNKAT